MAVAMMMMLSACTLAVTLADPRVMIGSMYTAKQGLNDLAKTAWKEKVDKYMGTATDVKQLSDPYYVVGVNNTHDFGMITPTKAMEVVLFMYALYVAICSCSQKNMFLVECNGNQAWRFYVCRCRQNCSFCK